MLIFTWKLAIVVIGFSCESQSEIWNSDAFVSHDFFSKELLSLDLLLVTFAYFIVEKVSDKVAHLGNNSEIRLE